MQSFLELAIAGLSQGGIYALLAFSLSLTISTTRILNITHGVFFVWGGAIFVIFFQHLKLPMAVSFILLLAFFAIAAFLFQWGIVKQLIGKSPHHLVVGSILATFGLGMAMESALGFGWVKYINPYPVFSLPVAAFPVKLGGLSLSGSRLVILLFVVLMVIGFHFFLQKTFMGRGARAMAQNFEGFLIVGLNPYRISLLLFSVAIVATAVSGVFYLLAVPLSPYEGLPLTIKSLTVVILAGVGSLPGALLAGALLGLAEVATSQFLGSVWAPLISYAVLFLVLLVRPMGLLGKGEF